MSEADSSGKAGETNAKADGSGAVGQRVGGAFPPARNSRAPSRNSRGLALPPSLSEDGSFKDDDGLDGGDSGPSIWKQTLGVGENRKSVSRVTQAMLAQNRMSVALPGLASPALCEILRKPKFKRTAVELRQLGDTAAKALPWLAEGGLGLCTVVARCLEFVYFEKGSTIYNQLDHSDLMYIIFTGDAKEELQDAQGKKKINVLTPVIAFGLEAKVDKSHRVSSVTALTDMECAALTRQDYEASVEQVAVLSNRPMSMAGLLSKPRRERDDTDLRTLATDMKNFPFFAKLTQDVLWELCRVLEYIVLPAGQPVFFQGDEGDLFYVILSGKVGIYILPNPRAEESIKVAELGAGDQFGELALINSQPRAATINTLEQCEFATLTKLAYQRTLKKAQQTKLKDRVNFLVSTNIFKQASRVLMYKHCYFFEEHNCGKGDIIVEQDKVATRIYFIEDGECRIIRRVPDKEPALRSSGAPPVAKDLQAKPKTRVIELAVLGARDTFGELSALGKQPQWFSVICNTNVKLLSISGKDMPQVVNARILDQMKEVAHTKEAWYMHRVAQGVGVWNQVKEQLHADTTASTTKRAPSYKAPPQNYTTPSSTSHHVKQKYAILCSQPHPLTVLNPPHYLPPEPPRTGLPGALSGDPGSADRQRRSQPMFSGKNGRVEDQECLLCHSAFQPGQVCILCSNTKSYHKPKDMASRPFSSMKSSAKSSGKVLPIGSQSWDSVGSQGAEGFPFVSRAIGSPRSPTPASRVSSPARGSPKGAGPHSGFRSSADGARASTSLGFSSPAGLSSSGRTTPASPPRTASGRPTTTPTPSRTGARSFTPTPYNRTNPAGPSPALVRSQEQMRIQSDPGNGGDRPQSSPGKKDPAQARISPTNIRMPEPPDSPSNTMPANQTAHLQPVRYAIPAYHSKKGFYFSKGWA